MKIFTTICLLKKEVLLKKYRKNINYYSSCSILVKFTWWAQAFCDDSFSYWYFVVSFIDALCILAMNCLRERHVLLHVPESLCLQPTPGAALIKRVIIILSHCTLLISTFCHFLLKICYENFSTFVLDSCLSHKPGCFLMLLDIILSVRPLH